MYLLVALEYIAGGLVSGELLVVEMDLSGVSFVAAPDYGVHISVYIKRAENRVRGAVRHGAVVQKIVETFFGGCFPVGWFWIDPRKLSVVNPRCGNRLHITFIQVLFELARVLHT